MVRSQNYNPLNGAWLSTLVAAVPLVVLLGSIAWLRVRTDVAALTGLAVALAILMGLVVLLQAYVALFNLLVVR